MDVKNTLVMLMVTVRSQRGEIDRLVIEDHGDVITVCRPEEAASAKREGRKPRMAPFKRVDIVRVLPQQFRY